jgi:hypothetical protein
MKTSQNRVVKTLSIVLLFFMFSITAQAQIAFDPNVDDENTTPAAPIDGLIGFSILMGGVIGYKSIKKSKS